MSKLGREILRDEQAARARDRALEWRIVQEGKRMLAEIDGIEDRPLSPKG